jgi:DNA-binding response OmpR family regulator
VNALVITQRHAPIAKSRRIETAMSPDSRATKVVVIEDDPEMVNLVKLILKKEGFEVTGAMGGREGLEAIEHVSPDLVLLDLMMPDIDGWEVYQTMKANDQMKHIPVIIITAKAQSIDKVLGLHIAKVDDYITKPFSPGELIASVRRVLSDVKS